MKNLILSLAMVLLITSLVTEALACTGIRLIAKTAMWFMAAVWNGGLLI